MDILLSHTTIGIIAWSKVILVFLIIGCIMAVKLKARPWHVGVGLTILLTTFTFVVLAPLRTMFFGTVGDELFMTAFFTQVLQGNPFQDFYYHDLPAFYPPLYFWIIGSFAKVFAPNAIVAAKFGSLATAGLWFALPAVLGWITNKVRPYSLKTIASNGWMWVLPPAFFLLIIDFDSFILKPYETISAVLLTYLMGLIAIWMNQVRWNWKQYASIIITSTFTFLSYYFWWFIMIPVLFILAATSKFFLSNIQRILLIGVGIFLGVSIYLVPLLKTLYINGIENWQAHFFIPHDFFTFIPWGIEDGRALLYLVGMVGLWLFRKDRFIMANLQIVMIGFLYQLTNILMYLAGGNPLQSIKPMLFLGSAAIMIGASAAIIKGVSWLYSHYEKYTTPVFIVIMLILIPQVPMIQFIDNRGVQAKLEAAQKITSEVYLSQSLTESISNIGDYTWLSSGVPALNAYIPMKYYIAHSPHFSHQASIYSERMQNIQDVIESKYPSEFTQKMDALEINALLFYKEYSDEAYPLIFWKDNYPNGGEELILSLPKELVNQDDWKLRYQDSEWLVFTRKYD